VLAIGTALLLLTVGRADAGSDVASVPLQLGSEPPGAGVWLDGHDRGRTPLEVLVAPGEDPMTGYRTLAAVLF